MSQRTKQGKTFTRDEGAAGRPKMVIVNLRLLADLQQSVRLLEQSQLVQLIQRCENGWSFSRNGQEDLVVSEQALGGSGQYVCTHVRQQTQQENNWSKAKMYSTCAKKITMHARSVLAHQMQRQRHAHTCIPE